VKDFYKSTKWKTKRTNILKRDNYMCQECKRYGKTTGATTVHHVKPLEFNYDLRLDSNNLISLCSKCHDKMHDRSNNELTNLGKSLVERLTIKTNLIV
jgi:5-methylcytosine-specific restriction endonuclease McrA